MKKLLLSTVALAAAAVGPTIGATTSAFATTVCFGGDAGPSTCNPGTESKIFLDAITGVTSFNGQVGSQTGTPTVDFTTDVNVDVANGFSTITPSTGNSFGSLDLTVPGFTFTDVVFSLQMFKTGSGSSDVEQLTINAWDNGVIVGTQSYSTLAPNADTVFQVVAATGDLTELELTTSTGFKEAKQFNLSGLAPSIPEPPTWAMMLVGFAGLGFAAGYRTSRKAAWIAG